MSKASNRSLFFYQGNKLITVNQGDHHHAIFRHADMPLAEVQTGEMSGGGVLATDDKGSVLSVQDVDGLEGHNFSAYGHDPTLPSMRTTTGFNGEAYESVLASYLLGLGLRSYSPRLRRFCAADNWSPFGKGGLNAYCYCGGDPINFVDPSGHMERPSGYMKRIALKNGQLYKVNENMAVAIGPKPTAPPKPTPSPASQHDPAQGHYLNSPQVAPQPPAKPQLAAQTTTRRNTQRRDAPIASPVVSSDSTPSGSRPPSPDSLSQLPYPVMTWNAAQNSTFSSKASYIRQPTDEFPRAPSHRHE
ncbi:MULTISPECIES: RHS repeat-associated core domain-containing protein [unclassified Pseudomonas]|jgi:RHS repeat-associated core domain|uniref:RHS repeat-associated core domain-containing protein n=1 Tax=unclassified Pseudomonas TaxID=196821 RepID=UPI0009DDE1B6|nr:MULTISPECIES: RHS repeat-associated core domain-containing protein [unclassified Pseudomonas]SMF56011.1 RHS repeat-associated core domain-containing protein [Pseudomonas sp. LAIL14HWK12:I11]SMR78627.1 RHS repeat-associated core domain-containing protein [Pseudomonas sp. LAIL14HWK12:I10]SOD07598.1 RHS repeat-associated core domain-containing protein [Pseudomonas sp. LAIL14HWK12:I8]